ncbi:hypothetical protein [Arthrobacter sp. fls2-241-R2A-200]|uniref:hypothetical protein n=1 Tax=Arthrobacter sp. fls2-241-R2A-200 TaxID=3040281 RepID=UPI00254DA6BD|nr:hypothetical protein [Arthrobacter sp. fls2-241-R2A-200]
MNLKVSLLVAAIAVAVSGSAVPTSPPRLVAPAKLDNPNPFPVSVFYGKPEHAAQLKDIGVNVYQNAEHDGSSMASITDTGMLVIAGDEWTRAEDGNNAGVVGWSTYDECDMGLGCSGSTTQQNLAQMQQLAATLRSYKDGRPVMANYSKGILGTWWASGTMNGFMSAVDFASADNYAYTSPPVDDAMTASPAWPAGASAATSAAYGWQVDRMRSYQATPGAKPNWVFVESARPYLTESNAKTITPEQMEGAMWSGIIHEARGISIFQHNNDPAFGNYSLVDIPADRKAKIKAAVAGIQALAPVLNTQSYVRNAGAARTDTMLKSKDGSAYLFAGIGLKGTTGSKTFTLPAGITGSQVQVVGENRTIAVQNGKFTDSFANEYTHHIYKITI